MASAARRTPAKGKLKFEDQSFERKVYFYRLRPPQDGGPAFVDIGPALKAVAGLEPGERLLSTPDGNGLYCWDEPSAAFHRLRLGKIRNWGLPPVAQNGNLTPLELAPDAGLAELTHMVVFPNGIVGVEATQLGPKPFHLGVYLREKAGAHCPPLQADLLIRGNALARLARIKEVVLFHIQVPSKHIGVLQEHDDGLADVFKAAHDFGKSASIAFTLGPKMYGQSGGFDEGFRGYLRRLAKKTEVRQVAERFFIRGVDSETGERIVVDLMKENIVAKKRMLRHDGKTRAVDSKSAFEAIEQAYVELKPEIDDAAGANI